jgi:tetratricopeptide (TPR) repeat protein
MTVLAEPSPERPRASDSATDKTAEDISPERIDKLIRELGAADYFARQRAQDELARLGFAAFDALSAAVDDEDLEIASRAKYLLRLMRVEWISAGDPPEVQKCLKDYESLDAAARQGRMQALAELPDDQGLVALCRLARFEMSNLLSKRAAMAVLARAKAETPKPAAAEIIRKQLRDCKRPGAVWLLKWAQLAEQSPDKLLPEWNKLIDAETALLRRAPNETQPDIIAALTRFQVAWLRKLDKNDEALAAMRRLVQIDPGTPQSVAALLDWLIEQKAWPAVDDLAARFAPRFAVDPMLLYTLAQAYLDQGKKEQAEQTAARALKLNPGKQENQLLAHLRTAEALRDKGQFDWAKGEYEHVQEQAAAAQLGIGIVAATMLSEMLHDQRRNDEAAAALEKTLTALDAGKPPLGNFFPANPFGDAPTQTKELRSRMHYFRACHWETAGDDVKRREALRLALETNPGDVDVLIACYQLPGQAADERAKIVELVKTTADKMHKLIAANPDDSSPYNQYAWLVGNTEGDMDEALRCAKKAVELQPDTAGYIDTLAHVHFARGEYAEAVKQQSKAVELDPHSGLLRYKLEVFRKKLAEQGK